MRRGDSTVTLAVSRGPKPRVVPGLVGSSVSTARAALSGMQLVVTTTSKFSDTAPAGQVISTLPTPGTSLARGSTVALVVSKGPDLVPVPSMSGVTSIDGAITVLQRAGLTAGNVSGPAAGAPVSTTPSAGQQVKRGSSVDIVLG